ncbi:hypothetical protein Nepgr_016298 [Nepenthes gracilis]|uniref:Uncharacterized protein n=1 Tax=Nepenthes gracilis TaxID=150966 RepID=A0AAD3XR68_NEPGR|nr:hypothetical protein Nepgr_016298 [Nepenthes gracilis]
MMPRSLLIHSILIFLVLSAAAHDKDNDDPDAELSCTKVQIPGDILFTVPPSLSLPSCRSTSHTVPRSLLIHSILIFLILSATAHDEDDDNDDPDSKLSLSEKPNLIAK